MHVTVAGPSPAAELDPQLERTLRSSQQVVLVQPQHLVEMPNGWNRGLPDTDDADFRRFHKPNPDDGPHRLGQPGGGHPAGRTAAGDDDLSDGIVILHASPRSGMAWITTAAGRCSGPRETPPLRAGSRGAPSPARGRPPPPERALRTARCATTPPGLPGRTRRPRGPLPETVPRLLIPQPLEPRVLHGLRNAVGVVVQVRESHHGAELAERVVQQILVAHAVDGKGFLVEPARHVPAPGRERLRKLNGHARDVRRQYERWIVHAADDAVDRPLSVWANDTATSRGLRAM